MELDCTLESDAVSSLVFARRGERNLGLLLSAPQTRPQIVASKIREIEAPLVEIRELILNPAKFTFFVFQKRTCV